MTHRSNRHRAAASALSDLVGAGDDTVVRDGASLLVRRGDVVVRVRPRRDRHIAQREVALARRLLADGVPVTPLVGPSQQPFDLDGQILSAWQWCPPVREALPGDVGLLAGHLRRDTAQRGPDGIEGFDPLAHVLEVVGDCGDEPDVCFVRDRAEALREPFAQAVAHDPLGHAIVHGDLHSGNVVVSEDGPLLIDLELGGWGPASYDTAAAVAAVRRYGASESSLTEFLAASGADPRSDPHFEIHVVVFELWVTAWALSVAHQRADWAQEAARRVAGLRDGGTEVWRLS